MSIVGSLVWLADHNSAKPYFSYEVELPGSKQAQLAKNGERNKKSNPRIQKYFFVVKVQDDRHIQASHTLSAVDKPQRHHEKSMGTLGFKPGAAG